MKLLTSMAILLAVLTTSNVYAQTCSCNGEQGYVWTNDRRNNPRPGGCVGYGADVQESVFLAPTARICGSASVGASARIYGNCIVSGQAIVEGARCYGDASISGEAVIRGRDIRIFQNASVSGTAELSGDVVVKGWSQVSSGSHTTGVLDAARPQSVIRQERNEVNYQTNMSVLLGLFPRYGNLPHGASVVFTEYSPEFIRGDYWNKNKIITTSLSSPSRCQLRVEDFKIATSKQELVSNGFWPVTYNGRLSGKTFFLSELVDPFVINIGQDILHITLSEWTYGNTDRYEGRATIPLIQINLRNQYQVADKVSDTDSNNLSVSSHPSFRTRRYDRKDWLQLAFNPGDTSTRQRVYNALNALKAACR